MVFLHGAVRTWFEEFTPHIFTGHDGFFGWNHHQRIESKATKNVSLKKFEKNLSLKIAFWSFFVGLLFSSLSLIHFSPSEACCFTPAKTSCPMIWRAWAKATMKVSKFPPALKAFSNQDSPKTRIRVIRVWKQDFFDIQFEPLTLDSCEKKLGVTYFQRFS